MTAIPVPPAEVQRTSAGRLLYIDNLRWVLITLVVVGHLTSTYGMGGLWYYKEAGQVSPIFTIIMVCVDAILLASLMALFALIAGYFTPRAYDRKGPAGFLLDRAKRLLIPLLIYEALLNPFICYVVDVHAGTFEGTLPAYFRLFFSPVKTFGAGPAWFLVMLLIFSLLYTGWRLISPALFKQTPGEEAKPVPGSGAIALFAVALGLVTFVVRIWSPMGVWYEPLQQEWAHYPSYLAMFAVGVLAFRSDWLRRFPDDPPHLWSWLIPLTAIGGPALGVVGGSMLGGLGGLDPRILGGLNWLSLAYSMWEAFCCVAVAIAMLTWFRRSFDRQNRLTRELTACSFGVFILHAAIIVPLTIALSGITMDLALKFLWVTPLALAACYGVVYLLRKVPVVRSVL
jgi:peptidoglycan/LPS O-acetylase OafA/YrhL